MNTDKMNTENNTTTENTTNNSTANDSTANATTNSNQSLENNTFGSQLAYAALDEIPTPTADAKELVGLVKSGGRVSGYQLSDGTTVSKEEGVSMAKAGEIKGVGISHRKGSPYLKSLPDGNESNNLSNLPSVSK